MTNIHLQHASDRLEEAKFKVTQASNDLKKADGDYDFVVGSLTFVEKYIQNVLDLAHKST